MDAHPLRGWTRWILFPLLCAAAGAVAGLLSELADEGEFNWLAALFGAALGVGVGMAGSLSSRLWLNLMLSPALSWICMAGSLCLLTPREGILGWDFILSILWIPQVRMGTLLLSVPAAAMHAWRLRRGRPRLRIEVPLAVAIGLAVALASAVSTGAGWERSLSETVFLVAYFVGNLFALEAALRIPSKPPPR